MNFNFGEVLSRAWQIIWKHKVLWIFGIFAGCSRGGGGGSSGGGGGATGPGGDGRLPEIERFFEQLGQWIDNNAWIIAVFVLTVLVLIILAIFLGAIGRIGLIRGTYHAEQGRERLVFGELFSESMPYFWRVFGLSLLIGVLILLLILPLILFGVLTAGIGLICILPLLCLLIPLSWAVMVVIEQANVAIVLEDLGIVDGLRRGWEVVRANVGTMIVMALILFIGAAVIGILLAIPIIITIIPAAIAIAAAAGGDTPAAWIWTLGICAVIYLPILFVLNGILTAYVQTAWALTYMRLTRPQDNVILEANA
ncbi:MAG TPA: hypothetical protein VFO91_09945 [Anaerolineales bacterium]|nr:hypothetical protein [Anaerolineales bacterium]